MNHQLQRQLDENRELAERDALTRVANRYRLEKALQLECERAQRFRQPLSLIAMDMDDFKPINDRYGHARGDAALVRWPKTCTPACAGGPAGALGRRRVRHRAAADHAREALEVAARLRQAMEQLEPVGDCRLTMSYGVVQWREGEDQHAPLARADKALYRAKDAGKNAIAE